MSTDNPSAINDADIVIVGGGIVGGAIACALSQLNGCDGREQLRIKLIESVLPKRTYTGEDFDPRVVALSDASKSLLQSLGVWELVVAKRISLYHKMHVWDGEGTASINFDSRDLHVDELGYIVENSVLTNSLFEVIAERENIALISPCKVEALNFHKESSVEITLSDEQTLTSALVIAADGANSKLRDMAGIFTQEKPYAHSAIVTTVKTERSHENTAWQRFSEAGPLAFLPLQSETNTENYCSIVWSLDEDIVREKMALSDTEFCESIAAGIEHRLGRVEQCDKRYAIPLIRRHAVEYYRPGFALVGDAAHTIHPLAGQGVNLGLYDVKALSDEIARAINRQVPLTDLSILKRYQRERKAHNLAAIGAMGGFKQLFGSSSLWAQLLRNRGMDFVDRQTWLKKQFMQVARG